MKCSALYFDCTNPRLANLFDGNRESKTNESTATGWREGNSVRRDSANDRLQDDFRLQEGLLGVTA